MKNIEKLKEMILEGKTNKEIANEIGCTPAYVSKLATKHGISRPPKIKHTNCGLCDIDLGKNERNRSNCKRCSQRIRRYRRKKKCVEYLGGECVKCGYNGSLAAMEFHHRESDEKEFQISRIMINNFEDVKLELDKYDLLCSNCHREHHSNYDDKNLIDYINK